MAEDTPTWQRQVLGDDHLDTLATASNFALALHRLGEYQVARDLNEDTLTRQRRVLGNDHPDTLASASNLARNLRATGQRREARQWEEFVQPVRADISNDMRGGEAQEGTHGYRLGRCGPPRSTPWGPRLSLTVERDVCVAAELGDKAAGGVSAYMESLAERFGGDGALVVLPVEDVLGAGSVEQVLLACFPLGLTRCGVCWFPVTLDW